MPGIASPLSPAEPTELPPDAPFRASNATEIGSRRLPRRIRANLGTVTVTTVWRVSRTPRPRAARSPSPHVWVLRAAAVFAILWSIYRAIHQSITLDEADTYLWFAAGSAKWIFYGFPNNHVLNSLLIWITTHLFGVSVFTVRAPALLGGALYVVVALFLCRAMTGRFALQLATLLCLIYNPFVLDYFAAARGYSLAMAFLLASLAVPVWCARQSRRSVAFCAAVASTAIALSFCANFSFAFVDLAALLAIVGWAVRNRGRSSIPRVLAACLSPGLLVALAIGGYPIAHYQREALWYGARSLGEMARSLADDSFYQLCEPLARVEALKAVGPGLFFAVAVLVVCRLALGFLDARFRRSARARIIAGILMLLVLTTAAHSLAFRLLNLPLPLSRTAIYFIPLLTLLAATVAEFPAESRISRWIGYGLAGLLFGVAAHYLLCLRSTHFREYVQAAEIDQVYRVMERLSERYGVREFTADGAYTSPLNFYRAISKAPEFPPLEGYPGMVPAGKKVYILSEWFHGRFMEEHGLAVVYTGPISHVVVAVPRDGGIPPVAVVP